MTADQTASPARIEDIFQCTQCGFCCQGETTVSLDENDRQRMVACLGEDEESVRRKYWRVTGNIVQMKTVDGHCIFYNDAKGCTVHAGRPWRCAQWPLHPSILADRANFETIKNSCPGINPDLSYEEFCSLLTQLMVEKEVIAC